jgi:hypothetical protein
MTYQGVAVCRSNFMDKDELIARLKRYEWNDVEFKRAQRDVPNDAYTLRIDILMAKNV